MCAKRGPPKLGAPRCCCTVARTGSARGVVPRKRGERTPARPSSERMRMDVARGRRKAMHADAAR